MATSAVEICNLALIHLGADTIINLTDDSKEARVCNAVYDSMRKELLRRHPWNFAIKRQTLEKLVAAPAFEFTYQYQLPEDIIRLIRVYNPTSKYKVEGQVLLSDDTAIQIVYVRDVIDPTYFDASFVHVFALVLASKIAYNLTGSASLAQEIKSRADKAIKEARMYDGQEDNYLSWDEGEWLDNYLSE